MGAQHVVLSDADSDATVSTDHGWHSSSVLQALRDSVALNSESVQGAISVHHLQWGRSDHISALRAAFPNGFDTIVTSDTLYYRPDQTYDALADTVRALAADECHVLVSYMVRHGAEHQFVDLLSTGGCLAEERSAATDDEEERPRRRRFALVDYNAAEEFSRSEPSHAPRVVELAGGAEAVHRETLGGDPAMWAWPTMSGA